MNQNPSEDEDDPAAHESSSDEWDQDSNLKLSFRSSKRLKKKPRISVADLADESDSEDSWNEEPHKRRKSRNFYKKRRLSTDEKTVIQNNSDSNSLLTNSENDTPTPRSLHRKFLPKTIHSKNYLSGTFVVLKKDANDPSLKPCIWRIDGRSLLQKFEAFEEAGKIRHKNTSVYTGWSPSHKEIYAPVTVDVISHNNRELTVEVHWNELNEIKFDSE